LTALRDPCEVLENWVQKMKEQQAYLEKFNEEKLVAKYVILKSKDDVVIRVQADALNLCSSLSTSIKNLVYTNEDVAIDNTVSTPIKTEVSYATLVKVVVFCEYHLAYELESRPPAMIAKADQEFCLVDQTTLFELILAANNLGIQSLLDLTCRAVANMIKGKTPEEIRKTFNIKNDFTPEEEAQVRRENEWAEEQDSSPDYPFDIPPVNFDIPLETPVDGVKLTQLESMGFDSVLAKKALKRNDNDVDEAVAWLTDPLNQESLSSSPSPSPSLPDASWVQPPATLSTTSDKTEVTSNGVQELQNMGFSLEQSKSALLLNDNNVSLAVDWLLNNS